MGGDLVEQVPTGLQQGRLLTGPARGDLRRVGLGRLVQNTELRGACPGQPLDDLDVQMCRPAQPGGLRDRLVPWRVVDK